MQLPGRLKATTLGDLLGTLYRSGATGSLELSEPTGRTHLVHMILGRVSAVEVDGASPSLAEILGRDSEVDADVIRRSLLRAMASQRLHGEVLVTDFQLSPELVDRALRAQTVVRLRALEQLADARICFRVALRSPRHALRLPLEAAEFLKGRPRVRDRQPRPATFSVSRTMSAEKLSAFHALGVNVGAAPSEIRGAYRKLVHACHPDLHPCVSQDERRALLDRFVQVTEAYRTLVA